MQILELISQLQIINQKWQFEYIYIIKVVVPTATATFAASNETFSIS